jgi:hypothetical protein
VTREFAVCSLEELFVDEEEKMLCLYVRRFKLNECR